MPAQKGSSFQHGNTPKSEEVIVAKYSAGGQIKNLGQGEVGIYKCYCLELVLFDLDAIYVVF